MSAEATVPLSLDVVRAKIFYLASDVEQASPPAAMLLRAVADAIDEAHGERSNAASSSPNGGTASALNELSKLVSGASFGGLPEPPVAALRRLALAKHRP